MTSFNSKPDQPTAEEREIIETLLKYPSLEKVFDPTAPDGYEKTKKTMNSVIAELERVVRRGTKQDAEKAEKIIEAYKTALKFLDELEDLRRKSIKR